MRVKMNQGLGLQQEQKRSIPNPDLVVMPDGGLSDAFPIDKGAVDGIQIVQVEDAFFKRDLRMIRGHRIVGQPNAVPNIRPNAGRARENGHRI